MGLALRRLSRASLPKLSELASQYSGASPRWKEGQPGEMASDRRSYYLVGAWRGRELVGYAIGRYAWGKLHLMDMAVRGEARGQGVGKALLAHIVDHARSQHLAEVYLEVKASNTPALKLYYGMGFQTRLLLPRLLGGEDVYGLFLPLAATPGQKPEKEPMEYTVVVYKAGEGGYWVEVPALPGCYSQGETREEALINVREAIQLYLEALQEEGKPLPRDEEAVFKVRVAV